MKKSIIYSSILLFIAGIFFVTNDAIINYAMINDVVIHDATINDAIINDAIINDTIIAALNSKSPFC